MVDTEALSALEALRETNQLDVYLIRGTKPNHVFRLNQISPQYRDLKTKEANGQLKQELPHMRTPKAYLLMTEDIKKETEIGKTDRDGNVVTRDPMRAAFILWEYQNIPGSNARIDEISLKPPNLEEAEKLLAKFIKDQDAKRNGEPVATKGKRD